MGFRVRRSVKLFPGVRINFSLSGVSASVGPRGASVTVGPRGTYLNLGVPGTGVSYRTRLDRPNRPSRPQPAEAQPTFEFAPEPAPVPQPAPISHTYGRTEYCSGPADSLSTPNLRSFTELVSEINARRRRLSSALNEITAALRSADHRLTLSHQPLVRWLTTNQRPLIARVKEELEAQKKSVSDQLEACFVDADFDVADDVAKLFRDLSQRFEDLSSSRLIWDISESARIDRVRSRSAASESISRQSVVFSTATIEAIESDFEALHLRNANGGDLFIFPCFVAVRRPDGEFAFLDIRQVQVRSEPTRFLEEQSAPSDAEQVGNAWARSNKDGSPDRRFAGNYQIPVYRYGQLFLTSSTGLNEAYMFSNWRASEAFGEAFNRYQHALPPESSASQSGEKSGSQLTETLSELSIPNLPAIPSLLDARGWLISVALIVCLASGAAGTWQFWLRDVYYASRASDTPAARITSAPIATSPAAAVATPTPTGAVAPAPKAETQTAGKNQPGVAPSALTKDEVAQLQRRLKELGFDPGAADGIAGGRTVAAVKAYEASVGRATTGTINRVLLNEIVGKKAQ